MTWAAVACSSMLALVFHGLTLSIDAARLQVYNAAVIGLVLHTRVPDRVLQPTCGTGQLAGRVVPDQCGRMHQLSLTLGTDVPVWNLPGGGDHQVFEPLPPVAPWRGNGAQGERGRW